MHVEHVVVETGHIHPPICIMERSAELGEGLDRIAQDAAVQTGMEIRARPGDLKVKQHQPAQATRDDDLVLPRTAGIGKQNEIRLAQAFRMSSEKPRETRAADLLLALDHKSDPQGQIRPAFEQAGHRRDMGQERPLLSAAPRP